MYIFILTDFFTKYHVSNELSLLDILRPSDKFVNLLGNW